VKCNEVLSTDGFGRVTIRCQHDRPCSSHPITPENTIRAVLAREVDGHTVPMLVLVRVKDPEGVGKAEQWASGIGGAAIIAETDWDYQTVYVISDHGIAPGSYFGGGGLYARGSGFGVPLRSTPHQTMLVAALYVHEDRWAETWVQLIDIDGFVVMHADFQTPQIT
jgi:hypothetical protein